MPFYHRISNESAEVFIWKYEENDSLNAQELLDDEQRAKIETYHPVKQNEYLMVRQLMKEQRPNLYIEYESTGEPFLNSSEEHISISHSFPFAAIALSPNRVGLDLEKVNPKFTKLKHKFLNDEEVKWIEGEDEIEKLTIIWSIKEAMYKLHPSKYWSLKKHYIVDEFDLNDISAIGCIIFDENFKDRYTAVVQKIEDYYLALIVEDQPSTYQPLS